MVIHYQPGRLRRNSDQPTAITDVLVATSGSSARAQTWSTPAVGYRLSGPTNQPGSGDHTPASWPGAPSSLPQPPIPLPDPRPKPAPQRAA